MTARDEERLRFLAEASQVLASALDYPETLEIVAQLAVPRFADWCVVDLIGPGETLEPIAIIHGDPEKVRLAHEVRRRFPESPRGSFSRARIASEGRPLLVPEITPELVEAACPDPEHRRLLRELGSRSALVLPLRARGRALGALSLASLRPRAFDESDLPFFEDLAGRCALALDNAALRERAERTADWTRRLQAVTAALSEALTPAQIATVIAEQGLAVLGGQTVGFWLVDATGQTLELVKDVGYRPDHRAYFARIPLSARAPLPDAIRTGEPVWIDSRSALKRQYPDTEAGVGDDSEFSAAALPLLIERRAIGAVAYAFSMARAFTTEEREFLLALTRQGAQALERARLYDALADEREALRETNRALSAAARAKDEFLATLAHELRTPLAPMAAALDRMSFRGDDRAVIEDCRATIARQLEGLTRLVDDLLDVARITHGKIALRRARVDLREAVSRALQSLRPLVQERGLGLVLELGDAVAPVDADVVRIEQVVANLVANAIKFTPAGGRVTVTVRPDATRVVLGVRDTGAGIRPEDLERVFEPFFQGSGRRAGLGIGLSLVRRLVELHGGTVVARSDGPGLGSELVVAFPLTELPAREEPSAAIPSPPSRLSLLIVDDEPEVARSLRLLLEDLGHSVNTAADGESALELVRGEAPDLVVLDIDLPRMDGHEVARRMRAMPALERTRIVALSGFAQESDRARSRAAGMDDHLAKPLHGDRLRELLAWAARETSDAASRSR